MKGKILTVIAGALLLLSATSIKAQNQALTANEQAGLINVRLVQKFVSDVYQDLADTWKAPLFDSIADAELDHTKDILGLYTTYGVFDELGGLQRGDFQNYQAAQLYEAVTNWADQSFLAALYSAGETEEVNIVSLMYWFNQTNKSDTLDVYNYLLMASQNHLRAIVSELAIYGETYAPLHMTLDTYNRIIYG